MPTGGLRMVLSALKAYGYEPDPHVVDTFTKYRKTHNEGVFDAYTADVRRCRSSHILTGLPDAYGRGRIIGDYRRVALYGVTRLIEEKQREKVALDAAMSTEDIIRDREELSRSLDRTTVGTAGAPLAARHRQALDLILSPEARRAFDLSLEPSRVRDRYVAEELAFEAIAQLPGGHEGSLPSGHR